MLRSLKLLVFTLKCLNTVLKWWEARNLYGGSGTLDWLSPIFLWETSKEENVQREKKGNVFPRGSYTTDIRIRANLIPDSTFCCSWCTWSFCWLGLGGTLSTGTTFFHCGMTVKTIFQFLWPNYFLQCPSDSLPSPLLHWLSPDYIINPWAFSSLVLWLLPLPVCLAKMPLLQSCYFEGDIDRSSVL